MAPLSPLTPTLTAHLFPGLGRELVSLLRSLDAAAWTRPTACSTWTVRDVAAHLLDSGLRRLAYGRDAHAPPATEVSGYRELVALLDDLNAQWVAAARRLSPRLLTDLLEWVEPQLAEHLASLDPDGEAPFGVAWAGETGSKTWFDVARELTERWHHQQQIRLAVGAAPLGDAPTTQAVFDTFLRVLPHRYRDVAGPEAASVVVSVGNDPSLTHTSLTYTPLTYTLRRTTSGWELLKGAEPRPSASIRIPQEPAWLLLTKGLRGEAARKRALVDGDASLAEPFFTSVAVMG